MIFVSWWVFIEDALSLVSYELQWTFSFMHILGTHTEGGGWLKLVTLHSESGVIEQLWESSWCIITTSTAASIRVWKNTFNWSAFTIHQSIIYEELRRRVSKLSGFSLMFLPIFILGQGSRIKDTKFANSRINWCCLHERARQLISIFQCNF